MSRAKRPPLRIIGLVGPSGAGKTTVCEYLEKEAGFVTTHVASPLKRAFCALFDCGSHLTERPYIEEPQAFLGWVTPRTVLEHMGNTLHEVAPAALPHLLLKKLTSMHRAGEDRILVDGIRRATEAIVVRELGGVPWRLEGQGVDPGKPCDLSQATVKCDLTIPWLPSKKDLYAVLDKALTDFFGGTNGGGYTSA